MSVRKIKLMSSDELEEYQKIITNERIKKIQKDYDNSIYKTKTPGDKLDCKICGGRYTRRNRSIHNTSKMHKKKIKHINKNLII